MSEKSKYVRLTKRVHNKVFFNEAVINREDCEGDYGFRFCELAYKCKSAKNRKCPVLRCLDRLAYFEDLKEKNRYFEKPCNIGDKVYYITSPRFPDNKPDLYEGTVTEIQIKKNNLAYIYVEYERINLVHCIETALGKVIFFDETAAITALKEREQNENI